MDGWSAGGRLEQFDGEMDSEHERRVSQLAALFGSDTNGHLRTNRNLTELW